MARDLVHPSLEEEKRKHKKKRLVQSPNSYFMDVKCPGKKFKILFNFVNHRKYKEGLASLAYICIAFLMGSAWER